MNPKRIGVLRRLQRIAAMLVLTGGVADMKATLELYPVLAQFFRSATATLATQKQLIDAIEVYMGGCVIEQVPSARCAPARCSPAHNAAWHATPQRAAALHAAHRTCARHLLSRVLHNWQDTTTWAQINLRALEELDPTVQVRGTLAKLSAPPLHPFTSSYIGSPHRIHVNLAQLQLSPCLVSSGALRTLDGQGCGQPVAHCKDCEVGHAR